LFGIILIVSGVRGTVSSGNPSLTSLIQDDFSGSDPFWKWMLAILLIGATGYIPNLRPLSRAFMGLAIVAFLLGENGNNGVQLFNEIAGIFKSNSLSEAGTNSATNSVVGTNSVSDGNTGAGTSLEPNGDVEGILNQFQLGQPTGLAPLQ
jgi:hypothetical protein